MLSVFGGRGLTAWSTLTLGCKFCFRWPHWIFALIQWPPGNVQSRFRHHLPVVNFSPSVSFSLRKTVLDAFTCCKRIYLKHGLIYRWARVLRTALSLALVVYHVLVVDLWQVNACGDVVPPCPQTLNVSSSSQKYINLMGCLLMLPPTVFIIGRAIQTLQTASCSVIFCACVCEIKDTDNVLPVKDDRNCTWGQLFLWIWPTSRCPRKEIIEWKVASSLCRVILTLGKEGETFWRLGRREGGKFYPYSCILDARHDCGQIENSNTCDFFLQLIWIWLFDFH